LTKRISFGREASSAGNQIFINIKKGKSYPPNVVEIR
jgi:hypothetical protein